MSTLSKQLANLRKEYATAELNKADVDKNPLSQFERWFKDGIKSKIDDINIMMLATATKNGAPSCRTVLLKDFSNDGFTFYTNYNSRKGGELKENPLAALTFFWPQLGRQVNVEGYVERVSNETSTEYFNSRPEESKIGAWASKQSKVIPNRKVLDKCAADLAIKFRKQQIPKPEYWGGYLVRPYRIEFWQSRYNRLHDRLLYTHENDEWTISRLSP